MLAFPLIWGGSLRIEFYGVSSFSSTLVPAGAPMIDDIRWMNESYLISDHEIIWKSNPTLWLELENS